MNNKNNNHMQTLKELLDVIEWMEDNDVLIKKTDGTYSGLTEDIQKEDIQEIVNVDQVKDDLIQQLFGKSSLSERDYRKLLKLIKLSRNYIRRAAAWKAHEKEKIWLSLKPLGKRK